MRAARAAGHAVHTVPGPSAAIAALTLAGLPTDRFLFLGFLPAKAKARADAIAEVADDPRHARALRKRPAARRHAGGAGRGLGRRDAAVAREITKLHEECVTGTLAELAERYADAPPKGEIVIVVGPPAKRPRPATRSSTRRSTKRWRACRRRAPRPKSPSGSNVPRKRAYARALERSK